MAVGGSTWIGDHFVIFSKRVILTLHGDFFALNVFIPIKYCTNIISWNLIFADKG